MLPTKRTTPAAAPVVQRKGLMSSTAYSALSIADKKESHRLEFVHRQAIAFPATAYLYHMTATLAAIKVSGLTTRDARGLPSEDPSKDAFISAAKTEKGAGSLSSKSTLLRFKPTQTTGPWKAYGAADEVRSMSPVPPGVLQKRTAEGKWVAL
jgi:hypothetical protein